MKHGVAYVPGMLRGKCVLHDPGDLHDPFFFDTPLLTRAGETPPPAPTPAPTPVVDRAAIAKGAKGAKGAKRSLDLKGALRPLRPLRPLTCALGWCREEIRAGVRNDNRHPLCERHKRAAKVRFGDGTEVSFCFYCNRTHDAREFTIKTNICDAQYLRRQERATLPSLLSGVAVPT